MFDSKLDAIIKNVKKQKKVFAKKEALDTSNYPTVIISRVNESEKILGFVLDYQQGYVVPLVSIYGRS